MTVAYVIILLSLLRVYNTLPGWNIQQAAYLNEAQNLNKCGPGLLLTNEVQVRYYLNSNIRILSLDGIMDGKVLKNNLYEFLLKERPDYYFKVPVRGEWFNSSFLARTKDTLSIHFSNCGNYYKISYLQ